MNYAVTTKNADRNVTAFNKDKINMVEYFVSSKEVTVYFDNLLKSFEFGCEGEFVNFLVDLGFERKDINFRLAINNYIQYDDIEDTRETYGLTNEEVEEILEYY